MPLRSVCVFCGSNPGRRPEYLAGAAALGRLLAGRGIRIVYGGAHVGTMGALADAVLAVAERFLRPAHRDIVLADADPAGLLGVMAQWRPEAGAAVKWMDADGADLHPGAGGRPPNQ